MALIFLTLQLSCAEPPKDSVTLRIQYKPETKYEFTSKQAVQSVIEYTGKQKALQELERRGIQNPGIIHKSNTVEANLVTGKLDDASCFPLKVEYKRYLKEQMEGIPVKATIHGKCMREQQPVFDIVIAESQDKKSKQALLESWQNTFSQLTFSGESVKIGEQISIESPYFMPMEGSEVEMTVRTDYKLISITDGLANFVISQKYTMKPRLLDNSFKGTAKGEGEMVYDVSNMIIQRYRLITDMEMNKSLDSFNFKLKARSEFVQHTNVLSQ